MSGRHSAKGAKPAGRAGRRRRGAHARTALSGAIALVLVAVSLWVIVPRLGHGDSSAAQPKPSPSRDCSSAQYLRVIADPRFEPVLNSIAGTLRTPTASGTCVELQVTSAVSSAVARDIAANGADVVKSDLWIPDSSLWLRVAQSTPIGAAGLGTYTPVVASSPMVMAMTAQTAAAQASKAPLRWDSMGERSAAAGRVDTAVSDPARTTEGLAAVMASVSTGATSSLAATQLRQLARNVAIVPDLGTALRRLTVGSVSVIPMAESDVMAHNAANIAPSLAAGPATGTQPISDYRLVSIGNNTSSTRSDALKAVETALTSPAGIRALAAEYLRPADGTALPGSAERGGTNANLTPLSQATAPAVAAALATWAVTGRRGRAIGVLDVSGSMAAPVPGSKLTRMQLAVAAGQRAVQAFASDSELGLWVFSTKVDGNQDFKELVPTRPLGEPVGKVSQRAQLTGALKTLTYKPNGGTALYATVLAATRKARATYVLGRLNAVVLLTDGAEEDPRSMGLPALLAQLKADRVPTEPVRVIMIAYGAQTNNAALTQIAKATGGKLWLSKDPRDVDKVLAQALAQL